MVIICFIYKGCFNDDFINGDYKFYLMDIIKWRLSNFIGCCDGNIFVIFYDVVVGVFKCGFNRYCKVSFYSVFCGKCVYIGIGNGIFESVMIRLVFVYRLIKFFVVVRYV